MKNGPVYEAEIRPNGRGGFEISEPDAPAGMGIGNYSSAEDAFAIACYNFEASRIKKYEAPVAQKTTLKLRQVKKGGA